MNKEQRLEIYHKMLNDFRAGSLDTDRGFCKWCRKNEVLLQELTELMHQKPHSYYRRQSNTIRQSAGSGYWWEPGSKGRRIKAIQDAINLVK